MSSGADDTSPPPGRDESSRGPGRRGRKVRVELRKNIAKPRRNRDWSDAYHDHSGKGDETHGVESVRAKGNLSRKRTVIEGIPPSDRALWREGLVVAVRGLVVEVESLAPAEEDRRAAIATRPRQGEGSPAAAARRRCTIRRVLRSRLIAERSAIAVGDRVRFLPADVHTSDEATGDAAPDAEGVIEEVLPRHSTLMRQYEDRVQVIAANVDQAIIVVATIDPPLRPHLIDRFIVAAHKGDLRPVICVNKVDSIGETASDVMALVVDVAERYRALGYTVLLTSATTGAGIDELRREMAGRSSVIVGVSGVGKSSLLNALQPGLRLRIGELSESSGRGQHTTTTAELLRLEFGGHVVDTPGIRQFELAHVDPTELEALFIEFVERVEKCKFSDCRHVNEVGCAIIAAVEAGEIHPDRYESYVRMLTQRADEE